MKQKISNFFENRWLKKQIGLTKDDLVKIYIYLRGRDDEDFVPMNFDGENLLIQNTHIISTNGVQISVGGDYENGPPAKIFLQKNKEWNLVLNSDKPKETLVRDGNWAPLLQAILRGIEKPNFYTIVPNAQQK